MSHLPSAIDFLRAVDMYLQHAYDGPPPSAVRLRIETLRAMPHDEFYQSAVLEKDLSAKDASACRHPARYFLRLGNQSYPHMKLALLKGPNCTWAFAVEEHDQMMGTPTPGSREYRFFSQMISHNRDLAVVIEKAWTDAGLPVAPRAPVATPSHV